MAEIFRLGHWTVRPQQGRIEGPGETIHVTPKSMAVLRCLADAGGEVVGRNDILDTVWPGADVTDDVLTHSISELRKAFGDLARDPAVIETIPKRGVRLMLDVVRADDSERIRADDDDGAHRRRPFSIAATMLVLAIVALVAAWYPFESSKIESTFAEADAETSIEVRPFIDRSPEKQQQHIADGLAEELANRLARVEGLRISGPRAPANPDAEYLLDGSVQQTGDRIRIAAQLNMAETGIRVWSHTFDRPYADFFKIQDEIAAAVATALSFELKVGDPEFQAVGTSNIHAFEQVMLGDSSYDFTAQGMAQAIMHYRKAARFDPEYAIAWQRIATYHNEIRFIEGYAHEPENRELANHAIDIALSLAPDSAEVLLTAADIAFTQQRWIEGRRMLDRAEKHRDVPMQRLLGHGRLWSTHLHYLDKLGYTAAAIELLESVDRRGDLGLMMSGFLAHAYLNAGRYDDAMAVCEFAYAQAPVSGPPTDLGLLVALSMGDDALIRRWLDRLVAAEWPGTQGAYSAMRERLSDPERAIEWLQEAYDAGAENDYWVTVWASYFGDDALALRAMRRTADLWAFWLPLTARVRSTAEFRSIVSDIGLVDYWREFGWNDYCHATGADDFACR